VVFWVITRRRVVIIYRRFGTTCRSHLHGSRLDVLPLLVFEPRLVRTYITQKTTIKKQVSTDKLMFRTPDVLSGHPLLCSLQTGPVAHTSIQQLPRGSLPAVNRRGCEAELTPQSSAEVRNAWSYDSTPSYNFMVLCLITHRYNFTCWFIWL
jgi:hypothetical protein